MVATGREAPMVHAFAPALEGCRSTNSLAPQLLDPVCCRGHVVVFPDVDGLPPEPDEFCVLSPIPPLVGSELLPPPVGVVLRRDAMVGTSMPEAPVDENGDSCASERQVGCAGEPNEPDAVPESSTVELPSESQLWSGIPARHASELAAHRFGQGLGAATHVQSVPVGDVR